MGDIVNIRCGSDIGPALQAAGVEGDFVEYSNPFCEGPLFADPGTEEAITARSTWMASRWALDAATIAADLQQTEQQLTRLQTYDEIRLWFEHDAYDQMILVRLLAFAHDHPALQEKLRWIVIEDHPAAQPRFVGLGQLTPDHLAALVPQFEAVPSRMLEEAATLWQHLTAGQARDIRCQHLPLFQSALDRLLADMPVDGSLPLTDRLVLQAISEGADTGGKVFGRLMRDLDPLPWYGDAMFWPVLQDLDTAGLIRAGASWPDPVQITDAGRAALEHNRQERNMAGRYLAGLPC